MSNPRKSLIAALFLVAAVVAFRLLPLYAGQDVSAALAGTSPLLALAFCGGLLLPRALAAGVTFGAFLISDIALNLHYGTPLVNPYSVALAAVFVALFTGGWIFRQRKTLPVAVGGTLLGVLAFYLVTNSLSFLFDPSYTKTYAGWVQAQTTGVPGFPPTWVFGLRLLVGNLVFALAFYFAARPTVPSREAAPATAPAA